VFLWKHWLKAAKRNVIITGIITATTTKIIAAIIVRITAALRPSSLCF